GARVASDAGTFTAGVVVGAGGHGCPVARALGRARVEEEVVVTQESETRVGAERLRALTPRHGWPELIAEPDLSGYGWYSPAGHLRRADRDGLRPPGRRARPPRPSPSGGPHRRRRAARLHAPRAPPASRPRGRVRDRVMP